MRERVEVILLQVASLFGSRTQRIDNPALKARLPTAKAMGLAVQQSILLCADRVIE